MSTAFAQARWVLSFTAVLAHLAAEAEICMVTDASTTHLVTLFSSATTARLGRLWFFFSQPGWTEFKRIDSIFDRELFVVMAAIHHFCVMLEGQHFVVFTDHKPLVGTLSRQSDLRSARQQCHLSFIARLPVSPSQFVTSPANLTSWPTPSLDQLVILD
jgi:hypothetical protein